MKKVEMVEKLVSTLQVKSCEIARVYGVACGVGYDLNVSVMNNTTGEIKVIKAHANNHGWCYPSHLRTNNPFYKYTGSCDRYQSRVINAWLQPHALECYYNEFKKDALITECENWGVSINE
jgi:hypothetical protein